MLVAVLGSSGADQNISQNVNYHPAQHYQDLAPLLVLPLVLVLPGPGAATTQYHAAPALAVYSPMVAFCGVVSTVPPAV